LSPHIDALASQGVVFDRAYAASPWTLPSVTSIFTSTFLPEHGVYDDHCTRAPDLRTLGQRLSALGYTCGTFSSNAFVNSAAGSDSGYSMYSLSNNPEFDRTNISLWLDSAAAGPFHLYVHTMEMHNPFHAPDNVLRRIRPDLPDHREAVNN